MRRIDLLRASPVFNCAVALLASGSAAAIRLSLTPFLGDRNQLLIFYPAIMVSAWFGGLWAGILATATSAALEAYLFLEPVFTFRLNTGGDRLALAIFVVTGVVISILNENLRRIAAQEHTARADAEHAQADANAANRTKDFFIAAVSHDLRAPMNAALGWADMLRNHVLDEPQRQHAVEAIRRALNRQILLVNDLLDTAAIVSGQLRVEKKPVNVEAMVSAAVEIAEPLATPKRLHLQVESTADGGTVVGDSARLQQVVSNLLVNAIKFTPEGGDIHVRTGRAGSFAEIRVSDTGRGIAKDALPFLFGRFWQGDAVSSSGPDKGIGLGLSIAKHLVVAHGGSIEARSAGVGQGATFIVRLPLAETPASLHVARQA